MTHAEELTIKLQSALELIAVGDVLGEDAQKFAEGVLVELGLWGVSK